MNEFTDQIAAYFDKVPLWPLVLLAVGIVFASIYELFTRKRRADAANEFRTAILATLSGLYPEPTKWPKSIDTYLSARLPVCMKSSKAFGPTSHRKIYRRITPIGTTIMIFAKK